MQDERPRRGNGRQGPPGPPARHGGGSNGSGGSGGSGGGDETRGNLPDSRSGPGMDSGFFTNDGFDAELDSVALENTALNNLDPIREAQLFEQFEQDYRSGGYDSGGDIAFDETREQFGPDPRDISGYRPLAKRTDSGYHLADSGYHAADSGYHSTDGPADDRPADRARHGDRSRHGKSRRRPTEGGARIPMFARKPTPSPARSTGANHQPPFGELTVYIVPITVAVVVVMVLVVLLLNR